MTNKLLLERDNKVAVPAKLHYIDHEGWTTIYLNGELIHSWKYEDWPALLSAMGFDVKYTYSDSRPLYDAPKTINADLHADAVAKLVSEPDEEEEEPDLWPHSALLGGQSE